MHGLSGSPEHGHQRLDAEHAGLHRAGLWPGTADDRQAARAHAGGDGGKLRPLGADPVKAAANGVTERIADALGG
jgi:hypothetical protein